MTKPIIPMAYAGPIVGALDDYGLFCFGWLCVAYCISGMAN